jgi:hypothetical protein
MDRAKDKRMVSDARMFSMLFGYKFTEGKGAYSSGVSIGARL